MCNGNTFALTMHESHRIFVGYLPAKIARWILRNRAIGSSLTNALTKRITLIFYFTATKIQSARSPSIPPRGSVSVLCVLRFRATTNQPPRSCYRSTRSCTAAPIVLDIAPTHAAINATSPPRTSNNISAHEAARE